MRDRHSSRDRWRALSHPERKRPTGNRKITSLVLMLALVLICIYQLNDPNALSPAFRAIGLAPNPQPSRSEPAQATPTESYPKQQAHGIEDLADVWQAVLREVTQSQLASLATRFADQSDNRTSKVSAGQVSDQVNRDVAAVWDLIDNQLNQSNASASILEQDSKTHSFATKWKTYRTSQAADLPDELRRALQQALQMKLAQ